jgi:hypothetical protein
VESCDEVLAGLSLGSGGEGGDGRLAVDEDVNVGKAGGAADDVELEDGAGDLRLEDGVLSQGP